MTSSIEDSSGLVFQSSIIKVTKIHLGDNKIRQLGAYKTQDFKVSSQA
jgi:hypothetical protein